MQAHYSRSPLLPGMERTQTPVQEQRPPQSPGESVTQDQPRGYKLKKSPNVINAAIALERAGLLAGARDEPICELRLTGIGVRTAKEPTEWLPERRVNKRTKRKWETATQITLRLNSASENRPQMEYRIDVERLFHQDGTVTTTTDGRRAWSA